jgi:hypothetical protein
LFEICASFLYSCSVFVTGLEAVVRHVNNEKLNNNNNNIVGTANLFL